jgi:hypothetical protein
MQTLQIPSFTDLERLLTLVEAEQPALLPACRWLVLGPELGRRILPGIDPSAAELTSLLRLLRDREPPLLPLGDELARVSDRGDAARVELCVDQLLEHDGWEHPNQVLDRPRPPLDKLLAACQARSERTGEDERRHVEAVSGRVERAVRIAEAARKKRERMQRRR